MNDSGARQGPADPFADRSLTDYPLSAIARELGRLRAGIWQALEALECGDQWLACDLLLALVDGGFEERKAA